MVTLHLQEFNMLKKIIEAIICSRLTVDEVRRGQERKNGLRATQPGFIPPVPMAEAGFIFRERPIVAVDNGGK